MQSSEINLTFDRGTLLLKGKRCFHDWTFDARVSCLRAPAIAYAGAREGLLCEHGAAFRDSVRVPPRVAWPAVSLPSLRDAQRAQLQACLYQSQRMTVVASCDLATIIRHAKLARLLVEVAWVSDSAYRIELSGPASILGRTNRHGVNFARFVAGLVACRSGSCKRMWRRHGKRGLSCA